VLVSGLVGVVVLVERWRLPSRGVSTCLHLG
jgi:hypothetical protein